MFCEGCGSAMEDNALFCPNCGWKVPDSFQEQESSNANMSNASYGAQESSYGSMDNASYGAQEPSYGSMSNAGYGAQEPSYGSMSNAGYGAQEPSYGSMSNAGYGAQEPSYGSMSNASYGAQEPSYGSMSNASYGAQEPSYGAQEPSYGSISNTGYGMQEPSYGAQEPSYGGFPQQNYGGAMDMGNGVYDTFTGQVQPPQKKKKKFSFKSPKFIVPVSIVAVLAICCIFLWEYVANFFVKTFASDETYYQYVEKKTALQMSESISDSYGVYIKALENIEGTTKSGTLTFALGDGGREILEGYTQELSQIGLDDLSWCSSISLDYTYITDDDQLYYNIAARLGDAKLVSINMTYDMESGVMYFQIPEISEAYFSYEMDYSVAMSLGTSLSQYADLVDSLPSQKKVDDLLAKYLKCIIESVDDVEKSASTIEADGISVEYTELSYNLDFKLFAKIMENIYKEAKNDKDLEEIFKQILDMSGMGYYYGDDFYDEFMEQFKNEVNEMKQMAKSQNQSLGTMSVWVDAKGTVVGREFVVGSSYNQITIAYYAPEKGDKTGFKFIMKDGDEETFCIEGSGKKSGDLLTGSYSVIFEDYELGRIALDKYNLDAGKNGKVKGSITLTCGRDLAEFIDEELYYGYGTYGAMVDMIDDYTLRIDLDCSEKESKIALTVLDQKTDLLTFAVSSKNDSNGKIPSISYSNVFDIEWDMNGYLSSCDFRNYIKNLDKSAFPDEISRILDKLANAEVDEWEDILEEEFDSMFGY